MFLGLITCKVNPSGKGPLSIISGALRKVIAKKKKDPKCGIKSDQWDGFDDEEKLAEVLHHVVKINDAPNARAIPAKHHHEGSS